MKKIFLYLSAFVPLYFLILIKIIIDIINHNLSFNILNTLTILTLIIAITLGCFGAYSSLNNKNATTYEIVINKKQCITEQYFLGYFSLFVLFAVSYELETVSMFVLFILIIILIGIVYVQNDLFYINPLLNILGYNFYMITYKDNNQTKQQRFLIKGKIADNKKTLIVKTINENFSVIKN